MHCRVEDNVENNTSSLPRDSKQPMESVPEVKPEVYIAPDVVSAKGSYQKPKKNFFIFLLPLLVLLLSGGVAAGYFFVLESPENIMDQMVKRMGNMTSAAYSMNMEIQSKYVSPSYGSGTAGMPAPSTETMRFTIKAKGVTDTTQTLKPKSLMTLDFSTIYSGQRLSIGVETRTIGTDLYVQATELPDLGFMNVKSLENQWIHINADELNKKYGTSSLSTQKTTQLTQEQKSKIERLYKKHKIIKDIKRLPGEKINGVDTHHFTFSLDKKELVTFLSESLQIIDPGSSESKEITNVYAEELNKISIENTEVWIGKRDKLLYKFASQVNAKSESTYGADTKIMLNAIFSDHNKPVRVEIPEKSSSFEDVLKNAMQQYAPTSTPSAITPAVRNSSSYPVLGASTGEKKEEERIEREKKQLEKTLSQQFHNILLNLLNPKLPHTN